MALAMPAALLVLAAQSLHFAEEFVTGFYTRFPDLLGLSIWTPEFFVTFNMACFAVWSLAIAATVLRRVPSLTAWPIWFLALAAVGNGIAHPVLAIVAGGYFPGLFSSPLVGVAGLVLVRALVRRP